MRARDVEGLEELALCVVATAVRDAIVAKTFPEQLDREVRGRHHDFRGYTHPRVAMEWIEATSTSLDPGTFGWWCSIAGFDSSFPVGIIKEMAGATSTVKIKVRMRMNVRKGMGL